jgi:hypothetical protein
MKMAIVSLLALLAFSVPAFALEDSDREQIAQYAKEGKLCEAYDHRWQRDAKLKRRMVRENPELFIDEAQTCEVCGKQQYKPKYPRWEDVKQ